MNQNQSIIDQINSGTGPMDQDEFDKLFAKLNEIQDGYSWKPTGDSSQ